MTIARAGVTDRFVSGFGKRAMEEVLHGEYRQQARYESGVQASE
jgi:hypothetical protein